MFWSKLWKLTVPDKFRKEMHFDELFDMINQQNSSFFDRKLFNMEPTE